MKGPPAAPSRTRRALRVYDAMGYFRGGRVTAKSDTGPGSLPSADFTRILSQDYAQYFKPDQGPVVSVVIPVFEGTAEAGRAREIEEQEFRGAMWSLIHNNRPMVATEIVLVVNGLSPEGSRFCAFGRQIGVRVVARVHGDGRNYDPRPQNIFNSRQAGLEQARGDIILHADSDNLFSDRWINAYYTAYRDNPELLLAYGPVAMYGATNFWGRLLQGLSLTAKTAQILRGRPRYAGHNHAMRRRAGEILPGLYGLCREHENEIPMLIAMATDCAPTAVTALVREAKVSTRMGRQEETAFGFCRWMGERIRVNFSAR